MSNGQISRNFLPQWIITNTVSLPVSLALLVIFIFNYSVNGTKPVGYVGLAVAGAVVGLAQWLVLRKEVSRIGIWWILTNIPGLYVGIVVSFLLAWSTTSMLSDKVFGSAQILLGGFVGGTIGGAIGGAITGITQSFLLARRVLVTRLWIIWILSSTVAWAVAWSLGWAVGLLVSLSLIGGVIAPSLFEYVISFVFGVIFGIISGFLNGAITGNVLVWAMLKSRVASSSGDAHDN